MATQCVISQLGGYDYHFIALTDLHCSICMLVPRNVHRSECCDKTFCKNCLLQLKQFHDNPLCPNCRSNEISNSFEDSSSDSEVQSLSVYCSHKRGGCQWSGTVRDIEEHLSQCAHQIVECTNGCMEPVYPHQLEEHLQDDCPHRLVRCPHCHSNDKHKIITGSSHLNVCPELPIDCPNKDCQEIIVQRQLEEHREECPKEMVSCIYASVGCPEKVKRDDLHQHNEDNMGRHLAIAMRKIDDINRCNIRLDTQINSSVVFKLDTYTHHKNDKITWYSTGFYTSPGGYRLCLSVFCNGNGAAANNYVSCFVHLLSGEYDDILEWPFQGVVTVELLNQLKDSNHEKEQMRFNSSTPIEYRQRVQGNEKGRGGGLQEFIPHTELGYNSSTNCQYLQDDTLYFKVSAKVVSKTRPWLVV